jgi:multiple sugar transport system permease protein
MSSPAGTAAATPQRRRRRGQSARRRGLPYVLLAPPTLLVVALMGYPVYLAVDLSLRKGRSMSIDRLGSEPLTLDNYRNVLTDSTMYHSLWITFVYTGVSTAASFLLGLATAMLLNRNFPGRRILRTAILIPWAVPGVVASMVFLFMLDGSYGVVNWMLRTVGLGGVATDWFFNPSTALLAVIAPTVWKGFPFFTLILLAALQSIPGELYEAANVDGAGTLRTFSTITWPAIRGTAVLGTILTGLWAFHVFDFIYPLTAGGPNGATETWAIRIYNDAFSLFHPGPGSALGILATILAIVVVASVFPIMRREFF